MGFLVLKVVHRSLRKIDAFALNIPVGRGYIISNLALKANISDETLSGLDVNARKVTGIWIAIWVGVLDVEKKDEVVSMVHGVGFWVGFAEKNMFNRFDRDLKLCLS
jgi:hypothetical protein